MGYNRTAIPVTPYSVTQADLNTYTTEANPFIPTTYDDLLAAIQTSGIYVKINKDFDFSKSDGTGAGDSGWRSGLTTSNTYALNVRCAKLFADDKSNNGDKYKISGLNSGASYYLMFTSTNDSFTHTIENIAFVNSVTTLNVSQSEQVFWGGNNPSSLIFNNCQISFLVVCSGYTPNMTSTNVYMNNCSVFIKLAMKTGFENQFFWWNCNQCTIQITGLMYTCASNSATQSLFRYLTNSTVLIDMKAAHNTISSNRYLCFFDINHCCFVLNVDASISTGFHILTWFSNTSGNIVVDKTLLDAAGIECTAYGNVSYLSTSEMKDETSLINAGFLP